MKMVQCNRGHYYDLDNYPDGCPHCRVESLSLGSDDKTVAQNYAVAQDLTKTVPLDADDEKTTRVEFNQETGEECVMGWLICVKGIHFGRDFRLHTGRNFVGRGKDMDVCLEGDKTVSRSAQAIVIYDPKSRVYMVQPGESRDLFYLNGKVVLESREIRSHDRLEIGEETLMFIGLCDTDFDWEKERHNQEG